MVNFVHILKQFRKQKGRTQETQNPQSLSALGGRSLLSFDCPLPDPPHTLVHKPPLQGCLLISVTGLKTLG
jgi:hypothetical protein